MCPSHLLFGGHRHLAGHDHDRPFPETIPFTPGRGLPYKSSVLFAVRIGAPAHLGSPTELRDPVQERCARVNDVVEVDIAGPQSGAILRIGACHWSSVS